MKNILTLFLIASSIQLSAQCTNNACENLPATIQLNVTAPLPGESYTYQWTAPIVFTGQSTSSIQITNVGFSPATIPYSVTVTNTVTGCSSVYQCDIVVDSSVPYTLTIPPLCENSPPIDIVNYISPTGAILSGPGITGTMFDPSVGGLVTASPPIGSGCLAASGQTPIINPLPIILGSTVTQ